MSRPLIYKWDGKTLSLRAEAAWYYYHTHGIPYELFPELINSLPEETRLRLIHHDITKGENVKEKENHHRRD